jgi:hypothetical protein
MPNVIKFKTPSWRTAPSSNRQCSAPIGIGPSLLTRAATTTSTVKPAPKNNHTELQIGNTLPAPASRWGARRRQWAQPTAVPRHADGASATLPAPKSGGEARRPVGATHCCTRTTRTLLQPHTADTRVRRGSATASGRIPLLYPRHADGASATHCQHPRRAGKRDGQWAQPTRGVVFRDSEERSRIEWLAYVDSQSPSQLPLFGSKALK